MMSRTALTARRAAAFGGLFVLLSMVLTGSTAGADTAAPVEGATPASPTLSYASDGTDTTLLLAGAALLAMAFAPHRATWRARSSTSARRTRTPGQARRTRTAGPARRIRSAGPARRTRSAAPAHQARSAATARRVRHGPVQ